MSKGKVAFDNLGKIHKRLMAEGRPAEAHKTAKLLVDLADFRRRAGRVNVRRGVAGYFTPPARPFAELIEGGARSPVAPCVQAPASASFRKWG